MTTARRTSVKDQLCSVFSSLNKEDPGGSAGTWSRCLVLELAKPWDHEVMDTKHFPAGVAEVLDRTAKEGRVTRLQCVAPDVQYSAEGRTRVMYFTEPDGPFVTYDKHEFLVPDEEVGDLIRALIEAPDGPSDYDKYRQETDGVRDLLVCTHGSRDVCCASFAYPIYHHLRHSYANESIRVWRTSHTGGHRLASNVIDMPEGRYWCRVRKEDIDILVQRSSPAEGLADRYRGWAHMGSPWEQMAEREALSREGWGWTGWQVQSQVNERSNGNLSAEVRLEFSDPVSGRSGAYEVTVEQGESAPTIGCIGGGDPGETEQYVVTRVKLL